jgi:4-amino-4-deoxy-L-arabinose transferase-like glycosyltransferase
MSPAARRGLALVVLWAAVVLGGLLTRPAWPIDETRYLAVAWEMWNHGEFLVPHLNGAPYSDKPPLLFWLIEAGWRVFGVHEWWGRVAPSTESYSCPHTTWGNRKPCSIRQGGTLCHTF